MVLNIAVVHVQRYKRNPKEPNFFYQDLHVRIPFESCLVLQQNINILYMWVPISVTWVPCYMYQAPVRKHP